MLMGKSLLNVGFLLQIPIARQNAKFAILRTHDVIGIRWYLVITLVPLCLQRRKLSGHRVGTKKGRLLGVDFFENGLRNPHKIEVDFKL